MSPRRNLSSAFLVIIPYVIGCSGVPAPLRQRPSPTITSAPPTSSASAAVPDVPDLSPKEAYARVVAAFARAGSPLDRPLSEQALRNVLAQGVDEDLARKSLEHIFADCLASRQLDSKRCWSLPKENSWILSILTKIARSSDDLTDASPQLTKTLRVLLRLRARGAHVNQALTDILERRHTERGQPCDLPSAAEVSTQLGHLTNARVSSKGGARSLTAEERSDLAYALATISQSDPPLGTFKEIESATHYPLDKAVRGRFEPLLDRITDAALDGNASAYVETARELFAALGYPDPMDVNVYGGVGWREPEALMREAALQAEVLGNLALAHELYLRSQPGYGECGTLLGDKCRELAEGAVRTAHNCRAAAAFMLGDSGFPSKNRGAERLASLGFDIARIYRGVILTVDTPESWDLRVLAIEGYADTLQGDSVDPLLELALGASLTTRVRAIGALGQVAQVPRRDPDGSRVFPLPLSSPFRQRWIRHANAEPATQLSEAKIGSIARALRPLLAHRDASVRAHAADTLGLLGDTASIANLTRLSRSDPSELFQSCRERQPASKQCDAIYPVRESAKYALEGIAAIRRGRKQ